jgi:hypothetical protein
VVLSEGLQLVFVADAKCAGRVLERLVGGL